MKSNFTKSITKVVFYLSVITVIAGFSAEARAAETRYPLTCRGGGKISWYLNHEFDTWIGANSVKNHLIMSFEKASGPSYRGLAAGQCAWADRAVASSEPYRVCISNAAMDVAFHPDGTGGYYVVPLNGASKYIDGLRRDTQVMTFWVYNDRQGCFRF